MAFALKNSRVRNSEMSMRTVINRNFNCIDFFGPHNVLILQDLTSSSLLTFPKDLNQRLLQSDKFVNLLIYNDTEHILTFHTHEITKLLPRTFYQVIIKVDSEYKKVKVSINEYQSFNVININTKKVNLFPYTLEATDFVPNKSCIDVNQITCVGTGGKLYLPTSKDMDILFGNNTPVNVNYSVTIKINVNTTDYVHLILADQEDGLGFVNKQASLEPNTVYSLTILTKSRVINKAIAGITRIV